MKISGITRKLDKLGRVVIPMDVRRSLDWQEETVIEISQFGRYLLLHAEKDRQSVPIELGTASPVLDEIMSTCLLYTSMYCEGQVSSFVLPAVQIVLEDIFA